jgi:hypothetical protein
MHVPKEIKIYQVFVSTILPKKCVSGAIVMDFYRIFFVLCCGVLLFVCHCSLFISFLLFFTNVFPSAGISMTLEQWEAFCNAVPAIEDAIKKLEDSD